MHLPIRMTRKWLEEHNACEDQIELFEETWPEGVVVTQKTLASSAQAGLNLDWLAEQVLSGSAYCSYVSQCAPLYANYKATLAAFSDDYKAKRDVLNADHLAKRDTLDHKYEAPLETLYPAHDAKPAMAYADYQTSRAELSDEYEAKYDTLYAYYRAKIAPLCADYEAERDPLLVAALWTAQGKETEYHEEGQAITTHDHSQVAQ